MKYFRTLWKAVKPRPQFFYKFHFINENLFELLETNAFWACEATELNDPYDCNFELHTNFIKSKYLNSLGLEAIPEAKSVEDLNKAKNIFLSVLNEEFLRAVQKDYISGLGVCCFSTNPLSELLWSHYAESGKGVCLKFSFRNEDGFEKKIVQVSYANRNIVVKNEMDRFKALFQKRVAWAYEEEWRVLDTPGKIPFSISSLVKIIISPRTQKDKIDSLKDLRKKRL